MAETLFLSAVFNPVNVVIENHEQIGSKTAKVLYFANFRDQSKQTFWKFSFSKIG